MPYNGYLRHKYNRVDPLYQGSDILNKAKEYATNVLQGKYVQETARAIPKQYEHDAALMKAMIEAKQQGRPRPSGEFQMPFMSASRENLDRNMDLITPMGMLGTIAKKGAKLSKADEIAALRKEANRQRFGEPETDYRGQHTAPSADYGDSIDNLGNIVPEDWYDSSVSWRYYGHGGDSVPMDKKTAGLIERMRGNPDADITVYRAVPKGIEDINPGDWVTINKDYAKFHGGSWVDNGNYDIVEKKVKAKDLFTDGNSIHEWGYNPD